MNEQGFLEKHEQEWRRLTHLCDLGISGISKLSPDDIREFVRLYRKASSALAVVRTRSTNPMLTDQLNDLVGRAYGILYQQPRQSFTQIVRDSVRHAAQTVRRRRAFVFASIALFLVGGIGSFLLLSFCPDTRDYLIPQQFESSFSAWKTGKLPQRDAEESLMMSGFYMSNNPKVSIVSGAVGAATFGTLSTFMILFNGSMIGTLAHEVAPEGHLYFLFSSISPHGVPEISGLLISGAAGLLLGYALINPGRYSRGEALREVGPDAVTLIGIGVALTLIAAPIEGFFSFNALIPQGAKIAFALLGFVGWLSFWMFYGREPEEIA